MNTVVGKFAIYPYGYSSNYDRYTSGRVVFSQEFNDTTVDFTEQFDEGGEREAIARVVDTILLLNGYKKKVKS